MALESFIAGKKDSCHHHGRRSERRRLDEAQYRQKEYMRSPEAFNGTDSATPEYFKIWNGEQTSLRALEQENPNMIEAFMHIAKQLSLVGQRTLPIFGESDVIYQPIPGESLRELKHVSL